MASYMMAMNINAEYKKDHPDITHQVDLSLKIFSEHKIKINNIYATLGRYDVILIFDTEDQSEAFVVAAEINKRGALKTETWPLISYEDFSELMG